MRENVCGERHRRWGLRLGRGLSVVALGLALSLAVAAPAAAEVTAEAQSPGSDVVAVAASPQSYIAEANVDPQAAFEAAFLACVAATGDAGECTEEVLENLGLEQEQVVVTPLPYNPNPAAATVEEDAPLEVNPPGT